ncbi:MAG: hypothetical protein IJ461_05305 [Clostridia bacterium]|nr:hypothetical protein [Clostridia bacterium]
MRAGGDTSAPGGAGCRRGRQVPEAFSQVGSWYIGGHSLGGSMAAAWQSIRAFSMGW